MFKQKHQFGFTLIELLVVIAIIGLLSTMAVVSLNSARAKSRDAKRRNDLKQIESALELYFDNNNETYPSTGGATFVEEGCTPTPGGWTKKDNYGANSYIPGLTPTYISVLPGDPAVSGSAQRCYAYYSPNGKSYILFAHMGAESGANASDPMVRLNNGAGCAPQATYFIAKGYGQCW